MPRGSGEDPAAAVASSKQRPDRLSDLRCDPQAGVAPACPLCRTSRTEYFVSVQARQYARCRCCGLRFIDPAGLPDRQSEQAQYRLHRNEIDDPRYRAFLSRVTAPLLQRLPARQAGLDYGCGPGPALACMLREAGHRVAVYDPLFCDDRAALLQTYDFVTCTEVVEHFHDPASEFARLDGLVRAGGWLALMTCIQTDDAQFADWHYRRDPTHVAFYRVETFDWLCARYGWRCEMPGENVVLMRKPD